MFVLVGLSILLSVILVHELGHFLVAKLLGIRIITFSVGFGPRLLRFKCGDTLYCLSAFPLGGYVRPFASCENAPHGEPNVLARMMRYLIPIEAAELAIASEWEVTDKGNLLARSFSSQACFFLAGVAANILFAFATATLVLHYFTDIPALTKELRIGQIVEGSPAEAGGLKTGDIITAINGHPVSRWSVVQSTVVANAGIEMTFHLMREMPHGKVSETSVRVTPLKSVKPGPIDSPSRTGVGLIAARKSRTFTWVEAMSTTHRVIVESVGEILGLDSANDRSQRSTPQPVRSKGPVDGVMSIGFEASKGPTAFVGYLIAVTIVVVLTNLLPLPALDGGQVVIAFVEKILRVPVSAPIKSGLNAFGCSFLLLLNVIFFGGELLGFHL